MRGIDDRLAGLGLDAFPDIGLNEGPAGDIVDLVRLALENPEDRVAPGANEALERAALPLQVDQPRRIDLVPVPGIVLMILAPRSDLAVAAIYSETRTA